MKISGVIAEYNPFHNGHAYHLDAIRRAGATHIVVVLGGNFTQRGEAALLPKADRVRAALAGGADLVIELPQPWSCASAEAFAMGGVSLLHSMHCVDTISFGSECGCVNDLQEIAACMLTEPFSLNLQKHLKDGVAYAVATQRTIAELLGQRAAALLETPNNTLGLEYCKALLKLDSPILPQTVKREGAAHDEAVLSGCITSASHIRSLIQNGEMDTADKFLPQSTVSILKDAVQNGRFVQNTVVSDAVMLSYLRRLTKDQLKDLPGISEGLENRLFSAIQQSRSVSEILTAVKTKRYPMTRLRRLLTAAFLNMPADTETRLPPYIRVLGMRDSGTALLSLIQKNAEKPLFTDVTQPPVDDFSKQIFTLECSAGDLYGSLLATPTPCGQEFTVGMLKYHAET